MKPEILRLVNQANRKNCVVVLTTSDAFQQDAAKRLRNLCFDAPFQGFVPFERADALPAVDARIGVPARSQINPGVVRSELIAIDVNLVD